MDAIHRIKCGNGNCYIIENGSDGILIDTGNYKWANLKIAQICPYEENTFGTLEVLCLLYKDKTSEFLCILWICSFIAGKREFADQVMAACKSYHVKLIVLTHAHFDHAENAAQISNSLGIPIGMNEKDCDLIRSNANQALSADTVLGKIVLSASLKDFSVRTMQSFEPDIYLNDGDSLADYGINASIIALPGHTKGSIGIVVGNQYLVVGDALMNMS